MALLFGFLVVVLACSSAGVWLIRRGWRSPRDDHESRPPGPEPGPRSTVGWPEERYHAEGASSPRAAGSPIARAAATVLGLGLIAAPWVALWRLIGGFGDLLKMGRVLRVGDRAQLAPVVPGAGWSDDPPRWVGTLTAQERRALGALWTTMARMEQASVPAFGLLGLQLAALGAPARLIEASHHAALDEIRHARACFAIVHALTGSPVAAGPIGALAQPAAAIDLTRLALEALIDGCVGEGIAAEVAARSGELAVEPAVRAVMEMIAHDEARHAELGWEVLAWCVATGGPSVAAAVRARVVRLDREATPRSPELAGLGAAARAHHGVIEPAELAELARARIARVQRRALGLLDARAAAPVAA